MDLLQGLVPMERQMPCAPERIRVPRYAFTELLDSCEQEEAAARVLSYSQEAGVWVGVSWGTIQRTMYEEYTLREQMIEAERHAAMLRAKAENDRWRYNLLSFLTLGIYRLFVSPPEQQVMERPKVRLPFSSIYMFGPGRVVAGLQMLVQRGLIIQVLDGTEENVREVFFPTPTLVAMVMERQGVLN